MYAIEGVRFLSVSKQQHDCHPECATVLNIHGPEFSIPTLG